MANKKVAVAGLWHMGCVYSASLSKMGFDVVGFDPDKKVVSNLNKGVPPIYEPELSELIEIHFGKNLSFSGEEKSLKNRDYVFITHDIEVDDDDKVVMSGFNRLLAIVSKNVSVNTVIIISSQVPVGTCRRISGSMIKNGIKNPKVIYFPENLRLGQAFSSFLKPDRIILGSDDSKILNQFNNDFAFGCQVITMDLESAEMVKHALNSYLALCISFSSELSDLSEKTGVNMNSVVKALKTDKRVSPFAPLNPGLGFSGGTLGRDVQSLRKIARDKKLTPKLLDAVYNVNKDRLPTLIKKMTDLVGPLKGKTIGILGLTYKPNTDTLRRSMSLELSSILKKIGCVVKAFDPTVQEKIKVAPYINVSKSLEDFFVNLNMVILMTDWQEFKDIDPKEVALLMKKAIVVDTKNFLNDDKYRKNGFTYIGMGII